MCSSDLSHAIHYTTQYQIDETFFPCRPKTDRRITSCEFGSYPDSPSDPPQPVPSPALDARLEVTRSESVPVAAVRPAASSEVTVPVSPVRSSSAIWDVISYDASTDSYLVRSGSTEPRSVSAADVHEHIMTGHRVTASLLGFTLEGFEIGRAHV